jgi:hypothetical protein
MCRGYADTDKTFVLSPATVCMTDCTYCGCAIEVHDPVYVSRSPDSEPAGQYCNYGCLAAHVDEADLATGTSCAWPPS